MTEAGYRTAARGAVLVPESVAAQTDITAASTYGAYKGAAWGRSASLGWRPSSRPADELVVADLDTLRRRSADLARNNPIAAGAIATRVHGEVGTGLVLHSQIERRPLGLSDEAATAWQDRAESLFRAWCESPDAHIGRTLNFYDQQALLDRACLIDGDAFVQLASVKRPGVPFRLALQHIEAPRVRNPQDLGDTESLVQGIERDAYGAPLAAHIASRHPDSTRSAQPVTWTRVPFYHPRTGRPVLLRLFRPQHHDQTRGVPYLAPVMEALKQLDRYTDAEIDAAVKNAMLALAVKSPSGVPLAGFNTVDEWQTNRHSYYRERPIAVREGESNVIQMFPDDDVSSFNPLRPNSGFGPFVAEILKQVGVALELPYEVLVKAFLSSYSASRAAMIQATASFMTRRVWLAATLCQPVYAAFVDEMVATGRLAAPGYFADAQVRLAWLGSEWVGDAPAQIDETAAVDAALKRVQMGVSTLKRETAALTGLDWEAVRAQRAIEERMGGTVPLPAGSAPNPTPQPRDPGRGTHQRDEPSPGQDDETNDHPGSSYA